MTRRTQLKEIIREYQKLIDADTKSIKLWQSRIEELENRPYLPVTDLSKTTNWNQVNTELLRIFRQIATMELVMTPVIRQKRAVYIDNPPIDEEFAAKVRSTESPVPDVNRKVRRVKKIVHQGTTGSCKRACSIYDAEGKYLLMECESLTAAAKELGVSPGTVYTAGKHGKVLHCRPSNMPVTVTLAKHKIVQACSVPKGRKHGPVTWAVVPYHKTKQQQ